MKLAIDVGYYENGATAAGVLFKNWDDAKPEKEIRAKITEIAPYEPGQFYKRELPCIEQLLKLVSVDLDTIVVDAFVWLSDDPNEPRPGLGAHLFETLEQKTVVIGLAKTEFAGSGSTQLLRGTSKRPLFVTAVGMKKEAATERIRTMHGKNRIPTLLKQVDTLSRIV